MSYIHRGFAHPGGVSPMKQEDLYPDPTSKVSVKKQVEKKSTKKKEEEIEKQEKVKKNIQTSESKQESEPMSTGDKVDLALTGAGLTPVYGAVADAANVVQNTGQAIFNAVTGDIKEAKKDATNALWAAGAFIPAGIGQWFAGMKAAKAVAKPASKTGSKVTADFLNNASEAEIKASKNLSTTEKVKILNTRVNAKLAKEAAEGGIVNGKQYYKGATHYGKVDNIKDFERIKSEIFQGVTQQGAKTDVSLSKMGFKVATDLKPQHVTKIGSQNNRAIFEVAFPDGTTQRFWRSTGTGGKSVTLANGTKVGSEGFFGTLPGHMDINVPGHKRINGWFVKGDNWQGYGSKTYKETGAVLKNMFDSGLIK